MSFLINRNPSGRIICLHSLLSYLYKKFKNNRFTLSDLKYDANSKENIYQVCPLLVKYPSIPYAVCPYLENPLSRAKCYLTQSIQEDKQKSKSASDAFNALEGLGFIKREDRFGVITQEGIDFVSVPYFSEKTLKRIRKGLLNYGPFVGLLYELSQSGEKINRSDVVLGYPDTKERIKVNSRFISLSTGSQQDTITRTRSVLFIWAATGAFVLPSDMPKPKKVNLWHVELLGYIKSTKWTTNKFLVGIPPDFFKSKLFVRAPLSYLAMTKSTKALRERNQSDQRDLTLKNEFKIRNRRFAIVYLLAKKSNENKNLNFNDFLKLLSKYPDLFVIEPSTFEKVMEIELGIANMAGIPYERKGVVLRPLTILDMDALKSGAPPQLLSLLDTISTKL